MRLHHVTLTTGHTRMSPRSEVSDDILAALRPVVRAGGGVLAGLEIRMDPAPYPGGRAWTLAAEGQPPAVSCVCCWSQDTSPAWWREAGALVGLDPIDGGDRQSDGPPTVAPAVPWLAVHLHRESVLALPQETLLMLGDAERCVAWALIEDSGSAPT